MAKDLMDKVYGCISGGAIGDALGAPVETLNYWEIREKYGKLKDFIPSTTVKNTLRGIAGEVTDDTTFRLYVCLAIVRKRGRITPDDLAELWLEKGNPRRIWNNERCAFEKISFGINPWDSGRGAIKCGSASMAIAPVGIINAGNPAQAYQDGYLIASVNQDGEERNAAGTLAAGVAAAFIPGATLETVLDAMKNYASCLMQRAIDLTLDLALSSKTVDEFVEKFYSQLTDWTFALPKRMIKVVPKTFSKRAMYYSGSSMEMIPAAMAILYLCKGDPNNSLIEAANFGRDSDTICGFTGSIAGALEGASAIRREWIETCERANRHVFQEVVGDEEANFYSMASCLAEALKEELRAMEKNRDMLREIVDYDYSQNT